ncbi:hypothetical protein [Bacteroides sp.]
MMPEYAITEWRNTVPWTASEQVDQDLRALTEIYKDEYLVFSGLCIATHKSFYSCGMI